VRTRERVVNIGGSVREFPRRLNIGPGGESMAQFRRQMLALSCCHMTLAMMTASGPAQEDARPIDAFQAWHTDEDGQQTLWPGYIRLTEKFFESLMRSSSARSMRQPSISGGVSWAPSRARWAPTRMPKSKS
jgi:hypothetical protein